MWIEMLNDSNNRWHETFPQYVGNIGMSESESAYQHELDHYKTWKAFYDFVRSANSYDGKHANNCEAKVAKLNARYAMFKAITSQHSRSFDTPAWNQGGKYELHPLDTSKFTWED